MNKKELYIIGGKKISHFIVILIELMNLKVYLGELMNES